MADLRLILASRSARRASLLREAGLAFEQVDPPFDDPPQPDHADDPAKRAMELACAKAVSLARALCERCEDASAPGRPPHIDACVFAPHTPTLILAADTICIGADGLLIGQPRDRDHARCMIRSFCNATHEVVTGVALLRNDGAPDARTRNLDTSACETFADTVPVTFAALDDGVLDAYLASDAWRGKAGGYNLFDRQHAGWAITIPAEADPTTVVGLPMRKLLARLAAKAGKQENRKAGNRKG